MILHKKLRSPKRDPFSGKRSANLYHYYAGFSKEFVKDVLSNLEISSDAVIMDPWNGSGTTTRVAREMGFSAMGFDINPAMVIVAKAKLLDCTLAVREKISETLESVISVAANTQIDRFFDKDPLEDWLETESASCFRNIERAIQLLLSSNEYKLIYAQESLEHMSDLACFFYLGLFKTLRSFLIQYVSSNPTWIKISSAKRDYIHPSADEIYKEFRNQMRSITDAIILDKIDNNYNKLIQINIERASSESIPLPNSSIDLVVSSPPYCTRIDYAISTSPELALLGCSMNKDLKSLRNNMIGTPTITNKVHGIKSEWGNACRSFLNEVETHGSKASKSYYYRIHIQYFDAIYRSLIEIDRILAESGKCVIVVQDSYYKNIHNDLAKIFGEMAENLEWLQIDRFDFHIKRTMAGRNNRAKKYRSNSNAIESVLIFEKNKCVES